MNIDDTSNRLAYLRDRIANNLKIEEAWPERNHQICVDLAEARDRFRDHAEFGRWLDEGKIELSHQDRAAAIAMGREPERLLEVLKATTRRSLRHIHANEWAVTRAGKSPKSTAPKPAPQQEKALHAIERMTQAGETITREAIVKEAGVGEGTAQKAMATHRVMAPGPNPDYIALSMSAQEKFDAKVRAFEKEFNYRVETKARELHRKWREESSLPAYFEKLEEVERLLGDTRFSIMPLAHFTKILSRLHPDRARPGDENEANDAFILFNGYKLKLVDLSSEKDEKARLKRIELRGNPLPRTVEEMLARKRKK